MVSILKFISFLFNLLPVRLLYKIGRWLGRTAFAIDKKHREIALKNLKIAFGGKKSDTEIASIARMNFENLAVNLMEFLKVPWLKRGDLDGYIECVGLENFLNAYKKGRGVILLTAHMGNWELMAAFYGLTDYPVDIIVRDIDNPLFDRFTRWVRTRAGNRTISKGRSMRELLRILRGGGIVGVLLDQNVTWNEGVFVNFFGRLACTNKGPSLLAVSSDAGVVPTFIVREGSKHKIIIGKEIPVVCSDDRTRNMVENTARFTKVIEDFIRKYPDQWFWIHQRWKTRPENDPRKGTTMAAPVQRL
jgi:KDO2-lipid IV(A) lauroyltransferase